MILPFLSLSVTTLQRPNFVVIFCDDMGIGDLSCYGNTRYDTPNIDRLAKEGVRFTDFYVAAPACTPSRAALLTGCYPMRIGLPEVLNPDSPKGLSLDEQTIPQLLKPLGYQTAIFGKWHLGVNNLMPRAHGFDEYFGIPYSHDMWPPNGKNWPPLFLYDNETKAVENKTLDDQAQLTHKMTEHAIQFIEKNRHQPFFLYLPHPMPHVPIAASASFLGRTGKGLYADTISEIDDSVGQIISSLKRLKLDKNTMVMFSSDNGPWLPYGTHAGSAGIYREGKGTTFEGGMREPGIFWWPDHIKPGKTCHELASTMDVLPTIAHLAGAKLPTRKIDGHDILPLITSKPGAKTPWEYYFYYYPSELQAVRAGNWKLHVPHRHRHQAKPGGTDGKPAGEVTETIKLSLFDLTKDPGEKHNVADQHPEIVARLLKLIEKARTELGDSITHRTGSEVREPGRVIFPKDNREELNPLAKLEFD